MSVSARIVSENSYDLVSICIAKLRFTIYLEMLTAADWIERLRLERHPENGYFRRNYVSPVVYTYPRSNNARGSTDITQQRPLSSAIYYLLESHEVGLLHRVKQDELWHHYSGDPMLIHVFHSKENQVQSQRDHLESYQCIELGVTEFQFVVRGGDWFGEEVVTATTTSSKQRPGSSITTIGGGDSSATSQASSASSSSKDGSFAGFSLMGCTLAPGYDDEDFEMAERAELVKEYPEHKGLIERLTQEKSEV